MLLRFTLLRNQVNRRHERMEKEKEELHHMLTQIMAYSNVAFFGLAGASLKLVGGEVNTLPHQTLDIPSQQSSTHISPHSSRPLRTCFGLLSWCA